MFSWIRMCVQSNAKFSGSGNNYSEAVKRNEEIVSKNHRIINLKSLVTLPLIASS